MIKIKTEMKILIIFTICFFVGGIIIEILKYLGVA
jgi:hypothetical protein